MMKSIQLRRWACVLLLSLLLVLAGCGESAPSSRETMPTESAAPERDAFSLTLLSTGKSDCAVIYMDGLVILNDAADEDDAEAIAAKLRADGVTRIDALILSHYDKDHIGAAPALIRSFEIGTVLRPEPPEQRSKACRALFAAERESGVAVSVLKEAYLIETANGQIRVEPPDRDYGDENNNSAITALSYRDHRLLLLGDAEKARLEGLLDREEGTVDFIKLPHHGDSSGALKALIRQLSPRWAAATVSSPDEIAPELAKFLSKRGVAVYFTADGPVCIRWNGESLIAEQYAA